VTVLRDRDDGGQEDQVDLQTGEYLQLRTGLYTRKGLVAFVHNGECLACSGSVHD
jgi:hypothetical protein